MSSSVETQRTEGEREREREKDRETERKTEREREAGRETGRQRDGDQGLLFCLEFKRSRFVFKTSAAYLLRAFAFRL